MSLDEAVDAFCRQAPGVRLLALGQTVFWDETTKAGVALALERGGHPRLLAGVHDTDYFAKLPGGGDARGFRAFPHNDGSTRGLWSAVAEFSALLGSEAVVRRDLLAAAGVNLERIARVRPGIVDEATEAWGWRGLVSLGDEPPLAADVRLAEVFGELRSAFDWALQESLACLAPDARREAADRADVLRQMLCDVRDELPVKARLRDFYLALLPRLYAAAAGRPVPIETTTTTGLLRFNRETAVLPRFTLVDVFLNPASRDAAREAYNQVVAGSETYPLDRFGTGALPFDLIVPGHGRGTVRIGREGLIVMTRKPLFASLDEPLDGVADLASVVERKWGPDCVLVGKAITLIGMLSAEFGFVFHEGASGYVWRSRALHDALRSLAPGLEFHPILRVRYRTWDALRTTCAWFNLPGPFRRAFGADDVCASTFAAKWASVGRDQDALLQQLGGLRRPYDLIRFLAEYSGGTWASLAAEYESLHQGLQGLWAGIETFRAERRALFDERRALRRVRVAAERAKGLHFREAIFEKQPSADDLARREVLTHDVDRVVHRLGEVEHALHDSYRRQSEFVGRPELQAMHARRREIELEAEMKRLRLARHAVIVRDGLSAANRRPSGWWFPLVAGDGSWFAETVRTAECTLERLVS